MGILVIFRQLKWRPHITHTNLGWFVFGVLLKAAGRRWMDDGKEDFTTQTNIVSHRPAAAAPWEQTSWEACRILTPTSRWGHVMKFQKGYGPIVQSFLHRKSCTKVEYTCWCIQKSSEKETVHLQVFSATDSHNTGFPLLLQSAEALRLSGSATCRQELSGKLRRPISHHHHSQHMITGTHKVCQKTKKGQLDEQ